MNAHTGEELHIIFGLYLIVVPLFTETANLYICCNTNGKRYNEHFFSSMGFMGNVVIFFEALLFLSVFSSPDLYFVHIVS